MIQLDKMNSNDNLVENFSVYIEQDFDLVSFSFPDNESLSTDALKSFLLEQFSQTEPPETHPIPKRLETSKRTEKSSRLSFQDSLRDFKPLNDKQSIKRLIVEPLKSQALESLLPKKPLSKSLKKAINVFTGFFKFSNIKSRGILDKSLDKSLESYIKEQENDSKNTFLETQKELLKVQESLDSLETLQESQDQFDENSCAPLKIKNEIINIKSIYKASHKKLSEKKPLLQKILITNFIISIVNTNNDVTLSRPKNIRKKLSRNFVKKKGDSRKAKEFLVKKGVNLVEFQTDSIKNKSENSKRAPGRSKKPGRSEEDVPLALLTNH